MFGGEPGGGGGCLGLPLEIFGGGGGIGGRGGTGPATFATAAGDATASGDGCQTPRLLVDAPSLSVRLNAGNSSTAEGSPSAFGKNSLGLVFSYLNSCHNLSHSLSWAPTSLLANLPFAYKRTMKSFGRIWKYCAKIACKGHIAESA